MGFQPPKVSAVLAGLGEAGGGTLLALGLATPVGGAAAASTMVAAGSVHKPAGFFAMEGGYEYNLILGLGAAALAIRGPGRYSVDRLLGDRLNRPWLAAVSLAVFGAASAVVVSQRQRDTRAAGNFRSIRPSLRGGASPDSRRLISPTTSHPLPNPELHAVDS